jgi:hypothetical protein
MHVPHCWGKQRSWQLLLLEAGSMGLLEAVTGSNLDKTCAPATLLSGYSGKLCGQEFAHG